MDTQLFKGTKVVHVAVIYLSCVICELLYKNEIYQVYIFGQYYEFFLSFKKKSDAYCVFTILPLT